MPHVKPVPRFPDLYSRTHSVRKFCATWVEWSLQRNLAELSCVWWEESDSARPCQCPHSIQYHQEKGYSVCALLIPSCSGLSLGTGTELHRLCDPGHFSGPEMPLYDHPGDGGLLEAEAQGRWANSSMHWTLSLVHQGVVRDNSVTFTGPISFSWLYMLPDPKYRGWEHKVRIWGPK